MRKLLTFAFLLLAVPALAQYDSGYPPRSGGPFTGDLRGGTGCATPPFSFTSSPSSGLCLDTGIMYLNHLSGDQTTSLLMLPTSPVASFYASDTSATTNASVGVNGSLANLGVLSSALVGTYTAEHGVVNNAGTTPRVYSSVDYSSDFSLVDVRHTGTTIRTYDTTNAPYNDNTFVLEQGLSYWRVKTNDGDQLAQIQLNNTGGRGVNILFEADGNFSGGNVLSYYYGNGLAVGGLAAGNPSNTSFGVWRTLIQGGYTLDGTTTASPASTVTITLADPETDSTPTTSVQVCGFTTVANQTYGIKACDTVSAVEGTAASASSFIEVTNIKASGKAGDDADDTLAAEFTTGVVSIRSATAITDHAKSNFTAGVPGGLAASFNYFEVSCFDVQGCDLTLDESSVPNGHELTLALLSTTSSIVFVDSDGVMELAGDANDTLNALDVIRFIYSTNNVAWLQTSLSEN